MPKANFTPVCGTKHMFVNYCNKGTQMGSHGTEARISQ